jgi:hypothetical protein
MCDAVNFIRIEDVVFSTIGWGSSNGSISRRTVSWRDRNISFCLEHLDGGRNAVGLA